MVVERSTIDLQQEYAGADLGDRRLTDRLVASAQALSTNPEVGFPRSLVASAELEGFYRLLRNEKVSPSSILKPHTDATVARMVGRGTVLVAHDTSQFRYSGERAGLGHLGVSGRGFLAHVALAMSAEAHHDPLGILGIDTIFRRDKVSPTQLRRQGASYEQVQHLESEHDRWLRLIAHVETVVGETASVIHLMDSEADDYDIIAALVGASRRFVLRLCYDRLLARAVHAPCRKTRAFVAQAPIVATRSVRLSRRGRKPGGGRKNTAPRHARDATLTFSAGEVTLRRPDSCPEGPDTLTVNIVSVREMDPPEAANPVEWLLLTTEPIETPADILRVADHYRGRWLIEEYFKALKTGCALEKRQLESEQTLLNAFAIFVPIAWSMLRLRTMSRIDAAAPARTVLTGTQIEILRRAANSRRYDIRWPPQPTAGDALMAVARLGGHLRSNGDPGWLVLSRGYVELLTMEVGFRMARDM